MAIEYIQSIFENTGKTYQRMLTNFRPCKPGSEFLEQNLITLFSHEFLKVFAGDACAYSEIPFMKKDQEKDDNAWQARLDGFLIAGDSGFLLEAKGSRSLDYLFASIDGDIDRISSRELRLSFHAMADERGTALPENMYGLIIADCWQHESRAHATTPDLLWVSSALPEKYKYLNEIHRWAMPLSNYDGHQHYLLGGWTDKLEFSRE